MKKFLIFYLKLKGLKYKQHYCSIGDIKRVSILDVFVGMLFLREHI